MNISKFGAVWAMVTGGWTGLATYVLEAVNDLLAKADVDTLTKTSKIVTSVAATVNGIIDVFVKKDSVKVAANMTVSALDELAKSLEDGKLTNDELANNIDTITSCISAWKEVA